MRIIKISRTRTALSQVIWLVMRAGSQVLFKRKLIPHAEGLEHPPCSGPVLIVARHFHFFYDGYVLMFPEGYPNIDPHPTPKPDLDALLPFQPGFILETWQSGTLEGSGRQRDRRRERERS